MESLFLLVLPDLEPDLDEPDATLDDEVLDLRRELEEALVLVLVAKAHDIFDPGPVVPTAVEDHDFPGSGKELNIALHEHLRLLAVGRGRQSNHAKHARAHPLGQGLDGSTLTGGIAPLEQ